MQHSNKTKEFGRERNQRIALWRTMLGSLIMQEKITVTEAKAKELKARMDRLINKAKKSKTNKVVAMRSLRKDIPMMAVNKIVGDFLNKFEKRKSGYTRITKIAPRKSDNAKMAIIEFIQK